VFDELLAGVRFAGEVGALRIRSTYQPSGGSGSKIAPPTYPNEKRYLMETRYIDGEKRDTVVVDSVQSQANRLEEALVDAIESGMMAIPHIVTEADVDGTPFRVTSLDAPHRSPDAYFRDSETVDGVAFDDSEIGRELRTATERNARPLYRHSPTDLVLGVWDSQRGGRGLRLPRAYTSEMIGLDAMEGHRAAGRLDPYNIPVTEIFIADGNRSDWALDASDLAKGAKPKKGKPSEVNHGNALAKDSPGGFSVTGVQRVTIVSLKVLRRLRFPDGETIDPEVDVAARAVLAALVIAGDRLAFADSTLFLRSGCDLVMESEHAEWIGRGDPVPVDMPSPTHAVALFQQAVSHAASLGLTFADPVTLRPKPNLMSLLRQTFTSPALAED
jgi:CRISPR-associated protein Csb1